MTDIAAAGSYRLGERDVKRMGYGAMQLAGPGVFGPPRDRDAAIAVLRAAVAAGVDHIDTSDFYGPHVTNQLIREALHPYPDDLVIVTKVGARRGSDASWIPARSPAELEAGVRDNLRNLGLDAIDVVNLRVGGLMAPRRARSKNRSTALAELKEKGLIRHLGLSNVTLGQLEEAERIAPVVCIQNHYNIVHRDDDAMVDALAESGSPMSPSSRSADSARSSPRASNGCRGVGATPMQVALAWLLQRAPNMLLIPGTSSLAHLEENLAAAQLVLPEDTVMELDAIGEGAAA